MKKHFLLSLLLAGVQAGVLHCQLAHQVFYGNDIHTRFVSNGSLFFFSEASGNADLSFQVPFQNPESPSTIFAGGLWLGTKEGDKVKLAAHYYGQHNDLSNYTGDFFPGPLNPATGLPYNETTNKNFDRVWSVNRHEILRHIADFEANTYLDDPILSIVGWPGHGNPYFHLVNGFDLPETPQGAAPFYDRFGDGVYNAFDGDYPLPEQVAPGIIPAQTIWLVFNDAAQSHRSKGEPLGVEVQLTAWAFFTEDNPLLNRTLFTSHKIINRSGVDLHDVYGALWADIDIGCFLDDYLGCIPNLNSFYGHNAIPFDSEECYGHPYLANYADYPPVQAVTLLNQPMSGFQYFFNPGFPMPPPNPNMTDAENPNEYFNYLTSRWRDGTPLTPDGNGYDPTSTQTPVQFAFPDNPNEPTGWSAFAENLLPNDPRGLGIFHFDDFRNGEVKVLDAAFSTHLDSTLNHVQQVNLLYDEIPKIQQWYAERFAQVVGEPLCEDDCVWAGDANLDGIANHLDLVAIAAGINKTGTERRAPLNWSAHAAADWSGYVLDSLNLKHLDCNGDGVIKPSDFELTKQHYGLTNENYISFDAYPVGNELFMEPSVKIENNIVEPEDGLFSIRVKKKFIPNLYALAFTVEYDPLYFSYPALYPSNHELSGCYVFTTLHPSREFPLKQTWDVDFAASIVNANCNLNEPQYLLAFRARTAEPPLPSNRTVLRFKNIRALLVDGTEISLGGQDFTLYFHGFEVEPQPTEPTDMVIFPNPSDGVFYIRMNTEELNGYQLFDATGRRLAVEAELREQDFMLDLRRLAAGIYFLQINQGGKMHVRKLMKR